MERIRKYSTGQVCQRFACLPHHLAELYKRGVLPEPEMVGRYKIIAETDLPAIKQALIDAKYIPPPPPPKVDPALRGPVPQAATEGEPQAATDWNVWPAPPRDEQGNVQSVEE